MIARFTEVDPEGTWMYEEDGDEQAGNEHSDHIGDVDGARAQQILNVYQREAEVYRREKEVAERELALMRQELELLRRNREADILRLSYPTVSMNSVKSRLVFVILHRFFKDISTLHLKHVDSKGYYVNLHG